MMRAATIPRMIEPKYDLLSRILTDVLAELRHGNNPDKSWAEAHRAWVASREEDDIELYVAIDERDADALIMKKRGFDPDLWVLEIEDAREQYELDAPISEF